MTKQAYLIPRRHLLRGMGTAALGLPLLEIMSPAIATASARAKADAKVKRLCVLYKGCGVFPHAWDIAGGTETEFELSSLLQPLDAVKNDLLVLRGRRRVSKAGGKYVLRSGARIFKFQGECVCGPRGEGRVSAK